MHEISDYELIYMIRQKNQDAYRILYNRYLPLLWSKIRDYQSKYSSYLPDVSDSFNVCMLMFNDIVFDYRMDKDAIFGTYVYKGLEFTLKNFRRGEERRNRKFISQKPNNEFDMNTLPDRSRKYDPQALASAEQIKTIIQNELDKMPEVQRSVIIGVLTGVPVSELMTEHNLTRRQYSYAIEKFRQNVLKRMEKLDCN